MSLRERFEKRTKVVEKLPNQEADSVKAESIKLDKPIKQDKPVKQDKDVFGELREKVQEKLIQDFNQDKIEKNEVEGKVSNILEEIIREDKIDIKHKDKQRLSKEIVDEITGFGPITKLLEDNTITEVMVNGPDQVYVERNGRLELSDVTFRNSEGVMQVIQKIVSPLGRRIDESSPMVDARLPNGSRVNAIIPPLALDGPVLTIRKFSDDPYTIEDLVSFGTLNIEMANFLKTCVKARMNILVSGGTGSGKTTTLNVLSSFIPSDERIVTIEDAAELQLHQDHVVRLESRPVNLEGRGRVSIRELVRNSLRMRPDRIIVGECRSEEAIDMLQAMNTGHDGSLTTGHANTPRDMLARLETMVMMGGVDIPLRAIREQVASAIDLIIQQTRFKDGTRKITNITEVQGMEGDVITLQDIYSYKIDGSETRGKVKGEFVFSGFKPRFFSKLD
jgi:pilus assembly protein CpaF